MSTSDSTNPQGLTQTTYIYAYRYVYSSFTSLVMEGIDRILVLQEELGIYSYSNSEDVCTVPRYSTLLYVHLDIYIYSLDCTWVQPFLQGYCGYLKWTWCLPLWIVIQENLILISRVYIHTCIHTSKYLHVGIGTHWSCILLKGLQVGM